MAVQSGDVLRVVCKMSWGTNDIQNTYHCQVNGTNFGTNAEVLSDVSDQLDVMYGHLAGDMPGEISFDSIEGYNVTRDEYLGEQAWPSQTVGGASGDPMPPQTSPLVLFNTAVPHSQGRKFLPAMSELYNDTDGTPTATLLFALGNYAASTLTGVNEVDWTAAFGNYRDLSGTFIPWLSSQIKDFFATQRRRYFGKGS